MTAATSVTATVSARRRGSPTARAPRTGSPRSSAARGIRKRWRRRRPRRRSRQRPAAPGPPRTTTRIRQVARSRRQWRPVHARAATSQLYSRTVRQPKQRHQEDAQQWAGVELRPHQPPPPEHHLALFAHCQLPPPSSCHRPHIPHRLLHTILLPILALASGYFFFAGQDTLQGNDRQQAVGIWSNKAGMTMQEEGVHVVGFEVPPSPDSSYNNPIPGNEDEGREPSLVPPHLLHTLLKPRRIKPAASTSDCGSEPPLHREREHKIRGCSGDHAPVQGEVCDSCALQASAEAVGCSYISCALLLLSRAGTVMVMDGN